MKNSNFQHGEVEEMDLPYKVSSKYRFQYLLKLNKYPIASYVSVDYKNNVSYTGKFLAYYEF